MRQYRIAIIGATGMVGQTFIKVLEERKIPISKIEFFASSKSKDKQISFLGNNYFVKELNENSFDSGFDFALFSAGSKISEQYAPIAVSKKIVVIDNSSRWRMDPSVLLIVPEVNQSLIKKEDLLIANPNCSTIQSVVPLKIISDLFGINKVIYSTYQAVSGSGYKGLKDLENGKNGLKNEFYPKPIYENCFPHIDDFLSDGYTKEEQKMIDETKKILGLEDLLVSATCVRIPVLVGHSVSINVECNRPVDLLKLKEAFINNENIVYYDHSNYPTPKEVEGSDLVHVSRLRMDRVFKNGISLFVVADNIRKGAATNAIQILEHMIKENLV
jgi:aspartate-semialdehyde dehydrogenase